jgi:hypothetical protein
MLPAIPAAAPKPAFIMEVPIPLDTPFAKSEATFLETAFILAATLLGSIVICGAIAAGGKNRDCESPPMFHLFTVYKVFFFLIRHLFLFANLEV